VEDAIRHDAHKTVAAAEVQFVAAQASAIRPTNAVATIIEAE